MTEETRYALQVTIEDNSNNSGLEIGVAEQLLELMDSKLDIVRVDSSGAKHSFVVWQTIVDSTPSDGLHNDGKVQQQLLAPNARILVVDDTKINLKVVTMLLKNTLIQVDTADGGQKSLDMCEDNKYDLIFMDHMMPEMDGIEAFKALRTGKGLNCDTPVVVLTANAILGAREFYLKAGFDDYMAKPVEYSLLESMLRKYLPKDKLE